MGSVLRPHASTTERQPHRVGVPNLWHQTKPIGPGSQDGPTDQTKPPIGLVRLRSVPSGNRADSATSQSRTVTEQSQSGTRGYFDQTKPTAPVVARPNKPTDATGRSRQTNPPFGIDALRPGTFADQFLRNSGISHPVP
jgi:hypothetical protein